MIAVTAVTMLILSFSLAGAILDEHLSGRSAKEAARLAASENRFRQLTVGVDHADTALTLTRPGSLREPGRPLPQAGEG